MYAKASWYIYPYNNQICYYVRIKSKPVSEAMLSLVFLQPLAKPRQSPFRQSATIFGGSLLQGGHLPIV